MSKHIDDPWEIDREKVEEGRLKQEQAFSSRQHSEVSPHSPVKQESKKQEEQRADTEKDERRRISAQVAYGGQAVNVSDIPESPMPTFPPEQWDFNYLPDVDADYTDMSILNRDINRSRYRLFHANQGLKETQRREMLADLEYRRSHARVMAGLSGGSEKQRTAIADLKTESEYAELSLAKQVAKEYESLVRQLRVDLDSLSGVSHNIRAQMNLQ